MMASLYQSGAASAEGVGSRITVGSLVERPAALAGLADGGRGPIVRHDSPVAEIQRTYRGSAARPEEELVRRGPERAVVIASLERDGDEADDRLAELGELLRTAGARVVDTLVQHRERPQPRTYLGRGKLDELEALVARLKPDLVAAEGSLSPGQQRALEDRLKTRVVDRTAVILDIFAQHARSAEGKLQVELAQLEYSYARQEGLWQHLERLGGGVGTRGPGRDAARVRPAPGAQPHGRAAAAPARRGPLARDPARAPRRVGRPPDRARRLHQRRQVEPHERAHRGRRDRRRHAVRDPRPHHPAPGGARGRRCCCRTRSGFIRRLPHQLVTAFSATLEEVREADLMLHVADASEPEARRAAQADAVAEVLDEIGAADVPRMLVLNKIDLADADQRMAPRHRHPDALQVSARTGEGLDALSRLLARPRARG